MVPGGEYRQEVGRELVIPCEAEGDPFPNITWRKVCFKNASFLVPVFQSSVHKRTLHILMSAFLKNNMMNLFYFTLLGILFKCYCPPFCVIRCVDGCCCTSESYCNRLVVDSFTGVSFTAAAANWILKTLSHRLTVYLMARRWGSPAKASTMFCPGAAYSSNHSPRRTTGSGSVSPPMSLRASLPARTFKS